MHNLKYTFTKVSEALRAVIPEAVERLNYLHPNLSFEASPEGIKVIGVVSDDVTRDIHYTLHRARIAEEARPLREMLHRSALL